MAVTRLGALVSATNDTIADPRWDDGDLSHGGGDFPDPPAGTDRGLIVALSWEGGGYATNNQDPASFTYNGQALTLVGVGGTDTGTFRNRCAMFWADETTIAAMTATGVKQLTQVDSDSTNYQIHGFAQFYEDCPATTPTFAVVTGGSSPQTANVTSVADGAIVAVGSSGNTNAMDYTAGVTDRADTSLGSSTGVFGDELTATGGSTDVILTITGPNRLTNFVAVIEPLASGVTISVPPGQSSHSATAPTVIASNDIVVSVPSATMSGSATAPTVFASDNIVIQVPEPVADFSATAPTVVVTNNVSVSIPAASSAFLAADPAVNVSENVAVSVPAAASSLSATAPTVQAGGNLAISIPVAAFTVTAGAVQANATNNIEISVPFASAEFAGNSPIALTGDNQAITIPAATLASAAGSVAPVLSQNLSISVPIAEASFVAGTVLVGGDISISVPTAALSVTGGAVSVLSAIPETPASRTFVIPARDNTFYIG